MKANIPVYRRASLWWAILLAVLALLCVLLVLLLQAPNLRKQQTEQRFVPDQVLLSGSKNQVAEVAAEAQNILRASYPAISFTLVSTATLGDLATIAPNCDLISQTTDAGGYVVRQYQVVNGPSIQQVTEAIQLAKTKLTFNDVGQDLNWVTGRPPLTVGGNPWGPEGSPWGPEGSPWGPEGSPWGPEGSPWGKVSSPTGSQVLDIASEAFRTQWAFSTTVGIRSEAAMAKNVAGNPRQLGENVLVGVFDTSPFPVPMRQVTFDMPSGIPLTLALRHPIAGGQPMQNADKGRVPNHGLFVAGLIHAVAPNSQIELIRVLDDTGQGDLQTLNRALVEFLQRVGSQPGSASPVQQTPPEGGFSGGVINLSLGIHVLPEERAQGLPTEVQSLRRVLDIATQCFPVVVVAASGNDSADTTTALEAEIPAIWGSDASFPARQKLIGIGASTKQSDRACFSNTGEVAAPGGDGGVRPQLCQQLITACEGDCEYGLLSLSISSPTGYTYWNGTSFSAPLVSGQVAFLLDRGVSPNNVKPCILRTARQNPMANAGTGLAIVDVQSSLDECAPTK